MSSKKKYRLLIPDVSFNKFEDVEDIIDHLIDFYPYLQMVSETNNTDLKNLDKELEKLSTEYNELCQVYGKLMQEYGVYNFQGSELFTRNTITGLKLGLLMNKLQRVRRIWGDQFTLDYEAAREIIQKFADRYLMKKEIEE